MEYKECGSCPGYCCMSNEDRNTPLTVEDVRRIAKHLRIPFDRFVQNFVTVTRGRRSYDDAPLATAHIKPLYRSCPFLRQGLCGINSVKPQACSDAKPEHFGTISCAEIYRVRLGWI